MKKFIVGFFITIISICIIKYGGEIIFKTHNVETVVFANTTSNNYRLVQYIMHVAKNKKSSITQQEAINLVKWCYQYGTEANIDPIILLAILRKENEFTNGPSQFEGEDSDGYIQMQSIAREWLNKLIDKSLPAFNSQEEFRNDPEAQIRYMVTYLKVVLKLTKNDINKAISRYNMGPENTKYNSKYVNDVLHYKQEILNFIK